MDDYSISSLTESKNEWCSRLVELLTPTIVAGFRSIFDEAWKVCAKHSEKSKYLVTFQTFLGRVPGWSKTIVGEETKRIIETSGCNYLADLITCVHIIQLKALSCVRVGTQQKKIDIDIPSIDDFIHKVYIQCARKIYMNVYLFERGASALQIQKWNRDLELIIKECIMLTIRESIPVEDVLRAYMEETQEKDTEVVEREEVISEEAEIVQPPEVTSDSTIEETASKETGEREEEKKENEVIKVDTNEGVEYDTEREMTEPSNPGISFSDKDEAVDTLGVVETIEAPKTLERLAEIEHRRAEEEAAEDLDRLQIGGDVSLQPLDVEAVNIDASPSLEFDSLPPL